MARKVKAEKRLEVEVSPEALAESVYPELVVFLQNLDEALRKTKSLFVKVSIIKEHEYDHGFGGSTVSTKVFKTLEEFITAIATRSDTIFAVEPDRITYSLNFEGLVSSWGEVSFFFPFFFQSDRFAYAVSFDNLPVLQLGYLSSGNAKKLKDFREQIQKLIQKSILEKLE